ncbi:Bacterial extracellular solute-binding protein, family 5 [Anopheles sinensis]|uniref:Bacterial extracellular solute-binding protein, family 5 n=1 Tax=Anopheles sinensis TaxID=74873 RepID=A0A084WRZ4_ANOSI|nr:Bacterial extracellular solute-binding protein, family 5 [Anopheles sinensis]
MKREKCEQRGYFARASPIYGIWPKPTDEVGTNRKRHPAKPGPRRFATTKTCQSCQYIIGRDRPPSQSRTENSYERNLLAVFHCRKL